MESTIVREDEDDESEMDILLLLLKNTTRAYFTNKRIERPIRKPITRIGYIYLEKLLKKDHDRFRKVYRMYPDVFLKLCDIIKEKTSLRGTRQTCLEEMVATFLLTIGQNSRYNYTMDTFERSKFAASTNFHKVLNALTTIAPSLMAKHGLTVPAKIRESTRYYPYFKDCVGAIDGTHIHAMVPASNAPSYRNRKGYTSQNVLAACNFDLEFIYVLSGWEGTAHDSKVLSDALKRSKSKLPVPEGKYYLVDCGFANRRNFLAPFRGTKYHLQDFRGQGCDPSNQNELFNLRHASLRNVIDRIFGIFKSRFLIFKSAPPFPLKVQAELVLACAGLHNFLRRECRSDEFLPEKYSDNDEENNESHEENNYEENGDTGPLQSQQREYANNWRDTIAASMWAEATGTGSIP
ncbi:unnamed protein product [Arabidopsis lyrata]|uniref:uncharacterized protein LOC110227098 isoform X1 n=2 Tax=Arabidopsis lyrata subsp. lyrata TaxID=81972 RepID=UPI000A29A697|nr:uncharacterized protein LOC110227098 isoform X1 [Arabidopsis lyrata subsp. lyrata]XP_020875994.1 uncharacterized protein LOC110227098 isoform X1 [Arabidopsis lyrata subsp. lyrata]CAH8270096.1 unnamed protein product [Arabidopsis lyrata]|eukprot:XP_020875993.1 uncharacterized protein LOC110227098 isoform X1 [Arabidopsis lyrata subsp. lyrata]